MNSYINNVITSGYNLEWLVFSGVFSILMMVITYREWKKRNINGFFFALGATLTEVSVTLHRVFWLAALLKAPQGVAFASSITQYKWLLYFDIQIAVLGMIFMARPLLISWLRRCWVVVPLLCGQLIFITGVAAKLGFGYE